MTDLRRGFRLGDRRILPLQNRIDGPGGEARVEPRVMDVLLCLAGHAGEVVSRETLNREVWEGDAVTDHALTHCVSELRRVLDDDASAPRFIATVPKRGYRLVAAVEPLHDNGEEDTAAGPRTTTGRRRHGRWLTAAIVVLALALGMSAWWSLRPDTGAADAQTVVAVVPFDNVEGDADLAYLRLALPDEITTVLTRVPGLAVRPFEPELAGDALAAGEALSADAVVSGHFYRRRRQRLTVILEALDVARERLLWRERVTVPAEDVLTLREKISARVADGLLPALGTGAPQITGAPPADAGAYRLYLRSLAVSRDPGPNLRGIELLRRAVELDPGYAPAWSALAMRYHRDAAYGDGGEAARVRSRRAASEALELDPRLVNPAQRLVALRTEDGALDAAYRRARTLVEHRGDSAQAHFALSYVLRYGGLLDASQRHCETALALDPVYHGWRSCAFSYIAGGEIDRAQRFIDLDEGSFWAHLVTVLLRLRQGDEAAALLHAERLPESAPDRSFLVACLEGRRGAELDALAESFAESWTGKRDPEPLYWIATELLHCGRPRHALELLTDAVDGGFCSYPAVDRDPVWDGLRGDAEFRRIRRRAAACHRRFREAAGAVP